MDPAENYLYNLTRRQFFGKTATSLAGGLGATALADLESDGALLRNLRQFAPKAERIIYLFQEGGPSHLDTLDYKPKMAALNGQDLRKMPEIYKGQRLTGMTAKQGRLAIRKSPFEFKKYANNEDGLWLSSLLPHTGSIAKEICVINSMFTEAINHGPGVTLMQTGHQLAGRPAMGAWANYGLGSSNKNLPGFAVLISQGRGQMQTLLSRYWGSAFLPGEYQGVRLRAGSDAVLFLKDPDGMTRADRRKMLDVAAVINQQDAERNGDAEVMTRVAQYEMAYRMQMAVPELTDFSNEDAQTLDRYGPQVRTPGTFAANCLLARRMAERGVRFTQLYHRGWDAHGNVPVDLPNQCRDVDQPQAALVKDLKQRGLLDSTLVIWGGEFGRTSYAQGNGASSKWGRDHHPRCFSMWLAGGGIKPGITFGKTDDVGYNVVDNFGTIIQGKPTSYTHGAVHVHDLHATIMRLMGIDHERLTYRYQGRDFRLTDIHGHVVSDLMA